jgi:hypothetical protein
MAEGMQSGKYRRTPGTKEQQERIAALEAHVAALVKVASDAREYIRRVFMIARVGGSAQVLDSLDALLDAPDIAALVREREWLERVAKAAQEVRENFPDPPYQDWEQGLIAALDAGRAET